MNFIASSINRGLLKLGEFFRRTFRIQGVSNTRHPGFFSNDFEQNLVEKNDKTLLSNNYWHQYCRTIENDTTMKEQGRLNIEKTDFNVHISFRNHGNLCLLKYNKVYFQLKEEIQEGNKLFIIDIGGVKFIDSECLDRLNLLSRLARKYNSSIRLVGVEPEVMEMIDLAKKYSIFDIRQVEPVLEKIT